MGETAKIPDQAVEAAQLAEDALEHAVRAQREDAELDHGDFYAYGSVLVTTLRRLSELAGVLASQVEHYGDMRLLRDDAAGDPYARMASASASLQQLRAVLDGEAHQAAETYFSEVGHVAVEVNP